MRGPIYKWISTLAPTINGKVLDIGVVDVNPRMKLRSLFDHCDYIGIDIQDEPGVDVVVNSHDMHTKFESASFDCVCCCEVFEHDDNHLKTLKNCKTLLRPGGLLILSASGPNDKPHYHPIFVGTFDVPDFERFFADYHNVIIWNDTKKRFIAGSGMKLTEGKH